MQYRRADGDYYGIPVEESYLGALEPHLVIDDDLLREAAAKALHASAPPAKLVALCQLVALLERR